VRKVTILPLCIFLLISCSVSEEDNSLLVAEDSTQYDLHCNGNGYFSAVQRRTGTIFGYRVCAVNL